MPYGIRMPTKHITSPEDLEMLAAALLYDEYSCRKHTTKLQVEIAKALEISQPKVSGLVTRARSEGWLQTRFVKERLSRKIRELVRQRANRKNEELLRKLKAYHKNIRQVSVLPCTGSREEREIEFGLAAAPLVRELLDNAHLVGVTRGPDLRFLLNGMEKGVLRPITNAPRFIPLCGEILSEHIQDDSSAVLVSRLRRLVEKGARPNSELDRLTLIAVPAFIPCYDPEKEAVLRDYVNHIVGYRTVFKGTADTPAIVEQLDMILTSAGGRHNKPGWVEEISAATGLSKEVVVECCFGQMGGATIERKKLSKEQKRLVRAWTGVQQEHFARCANAAAQDASKVGVVLLNIGLEHVEATLECVKRGFVNHLIVDYEFGEELRAQN